MTKEQQLVACRECVSMLSQMSEEMGDCLTAAMISMHRLNGPEYDEVREHLDRAVAIFDKCHAELERIKAVKGTKNGIVVGG